MAPLVPPQADCGWIGEAGPGLSYADPDSGGRQNEFTRRNTTFMTWNLRHMARMLRYAGERFDPRSSQTGQGATRRA